MSLPLVVQKVLSAPSPDDLWRLRGELLEAGVPEEARVWTVIDRFHRFLDQLATSTSSREYSNLASKLDIGAISGVVLEEVLTPTQDGQLTRRVLSGLLTEGLMVLATRQHVKAWECELAAVHRDAAWYLYEELWRWAERTKPELAPRERRRLLDDLMAPVRESRNEGPDKAVLIGLLFQVLLVDSLAREMVRLQAR